jgi:hypothetical protein
MLKFRQPTDELPAPLATLWRRALRQSATLKAVSAAMAHAPTLDDCAASIERAKQELEHLECSVELYRELCGGDLSDEIAGAAAALPAPESWLEAAVAQLVLCVASPLEAQAEVSAAGTRRARVRQLAEETEHVDAARAALSEVCATAPASFAAISKLVSRWLNVALETLDSSARAAYLEGLRREISRLGLDAAVLAA